MKVQSFYQTRQNFFLEVKFIILSLITQGLRSGAILSQFDHTKLEIRCNYLLFSHFFFFFFGCCCFLHGGSLLLATRCCSCSDFVKFLTLTFLLLFKIFNLMVEIKSCFLQPLTSSINCNCIRALPSDVLNAKYLAFDTPNTTIQAS